MKAIRVLTYEAEDEQRLLQVLDRSLGEGIHNFWGLTITVRVLEGPAVGIYPMNTRPELNYDKQETVYKRLQREAKNHLPTAECQDPECMVCGVRDCPHQEPLHYHHDGCPVCHHEEKANE